MTEVVILEVAEQGPPGIQGIRGIQGEPGSGGGAAVDINPNLLPTNPTSNSFGGFTFSSSSAASTGHEPYKACVDAGSFSIPVATANYGWMQIDFPSPVTIHDLMAVFQSDEGNLSDATLSGLNEYGGWDTITNLDGAFNGNNRFSFLNNGAYTSYRIGFYNGGGFGDYVYISQLQIREYPTIGEIDFGVDQTIAFLSIAPVPPGRSLLDYNSPYFLQQQSTVDHNAADHRTIGLDCILTQIPSKYSIAINAASRVPLSGKYKVGYK